MQGFSRSICVECAGLSKDVTKYMKYAV